MTADTCIVYYHSSPWDGIPGRQRYLMEALSRHLPVIYIEEVSDRKWNVTYEQRGANVTLVRGLAPLLVKFERRKWNVAMRIWCLWRLSWLRRKYRRVIFWNAENWLRPNRFVPHDLLVFDCIDPCFSDDLADLSLFAQRERELLSVAQTVFASADSLVDECRKHHGDVTLLNNACEPREYDSVKLATAQRPAWWPQTNNPIAAYLGTLDWRFDFGSTLAACRFNPKVHFIIAGGIIPGLETKVAELKQMANVTVSGRISVEDGRYLLSQCSVGLIPFTAGRMNDAVNPVKMYAYALLGKPVVGTAIHELTSRPHIATTGRTPEQFAAAVGRGIEMSREGATVRDLTEFAMQNTWDHRARQVLQKLAPELLKQSCGPSYLVGNA